MSYAFRQKGGFNWHRGTNWGMCYSDKNAMLYLVMFLGGIN